MVGIALTVLLAIRADAAGAGVSYGESFRLVESAGTAGSGGVALEDVWVSEPRIEAASITLDPGLQWYRLSCEGFLGPDLRAGAEVFRFSADDIPRLGESADGAQAVEEGTMSPQEWGFRLKGELPVWRGSTWETRALAQANGSVLQIPDVTDVGFGLDAGLKHRQRIGEIRSVLAWGTVGPLGYGGENWFAGQLTAGAALVDPDVRVFGSAGGQVFGAEIEVLGESVVHYGFATVHWLGDPAHQGPTLFLRAGLRYRPGTAQDVQMRGGVGLLARLGNGWAPQFDYSYVPMGDLGALHYVSLGLRLGGKETEVPGWAH